MMDEKIITIEKMVYGGKGLSRDLDKVTFVPLTLPGEKVRVRITKQHADYQEAAAIDILQPSSERVAPACRYFGICGGCQLSHANYAEQVKIKLQVLRETLRRNDVLFPEIQLIESKPFGYRHRAQLKYDSTHRTLGFYATESNRVVDIQECLCLTPGLNAALQAARSEVCTQSLPTLREIEIYENEHQKTATFFRPSTAHNTGRQPDDLTISFRGHRFPMNPNIFLQINAGLWRTMIQEVESHYESCREQKALELYCGAGFFTAPLSARFASIIACEENSEAVQYAKANHALKNVQWICNKVETFQFPPDMHAVIVDPPRAGLHQTVLRQLIERKPKWITYISCDCTTFARDLKKIRTFYRIEKLTMLDLFPQTYHFETIALLKRL